MDALTIALQNLISSSI
ncbi:MAG: hypothetical protein ACLU4J_13820 [Butyricimonas paravirosa]